MTEREVNHNVERLKVKIKYLEKDNKDLQLDLDDLEATLQINKSIISSLVDARTDIDEGTVKIMKKLQQEVDQANSRADRLQAERDEIKAQLLVSDQVSKNVKSREEELSSHYDLEIQRLVEQVEKKEYTLQLLEQRLFDCEKFLRKWGRDDPFIRDQLKYLKINPDLRKKKITNVVEENRLLKEQLKESLDEIEELHKKVTELSKNPNDTTFLKNSIIHDRSKIDMFMANEMFGDDNFGPIPEVSRGEEIMNLATQTSSKQKETTDRKERKHKKNRKNIEKELEAYESSTYNKIMLDVNKIKSLKEAYPEEYKAKLEANQDMLQKNFKTLKKEMDSIKQENIRLKDLIEVYKNNYEKVNHAYAKSKTKVEQLEKQLGNLRDAISENDDSMFDRASSKPSIDRVQSNIANTIKTINDTMEKHKGNKLIAQTLNELSSIDFGPDDLPKDFKAFAADTFEDHKDNEVIHNNLIKKSIVGQKSVKLGTRVSKIVDYEEKVRKKDLL